MTHYWRWLGRNWRQRPCANWLLGDDTITITTAATNQKGTWPP